MALTELGAAPATYRRMTTTVVPAARAARLRFGLSATSRAFLAIAIPSFRRGMLFRAQLVHRRGGVDGRRAAHPAHFAASFSGCSLSCRVVERVEGEGGALLL